MSDEIKVAGIVKESIVDGPGIRFVVFTQGCKHKCPGCHNPKTHSFNEGTVVSVDSVINTVSKNPILDGITISGGEPFEQAEACAELADKIRSMGLNVITYTGYTYEHLTELSTKNKQWSKLLDTTDILVDGKFEISKKNGRLKFRGSENQRIIDVKQSRKRNKIILADI